MPIYAAEMTHTAVTCPVFNDEVKKKYQEGIAKREASAKTNGIRVIVGCSNVLEHWVLYVVEAPSQKAAEEYFKESGWAFFNNIRIREMQLIEEVQQRYGLA
jgi:hypothetical protein